MSCFATGPRWGVSGDATLNSTAKFDWTIRPFGQTMRTSQQTKPRRSHDFSKELGIGRPSQQPKRQYSSFSSEVWLGRSLYQPLVRGSRSSLRVSHQSQRRQSEERSRPSSQMEQHLMAPRRSLRLSQLASQPSEKQSRLSQQAILPSEVSLDVLNQHIGTKYTDASEVPVELSSARYHEIASSMSKSVEDVMSSMLPGGSNNMQWKFKLRKKNIAYFLDETNVKPGQTRFCCVSHTHATVDEIMGLFLPTDKDAVLRNNKLIHDNVIDAKVLLTLRGPTKERPMNSMYVRYSSFRTSGPLSNREMYVAVATDMIRQSDGSTIGYCLWDSIDDYGNLQVAKTTGLEVSTSFRSGFFFRHPGRTESASGYPMHGHTKIVYMVGIDGGCRASCLSPRLVMEKHGSAVDRLCSHFRQKHFDPCTFVAKTQWNSKCAAKSCKQCDKPFQLLSNRVNCHACGHVVCRTCVSKESVELPNVGHVSIHMCYVCLEKAGLPTAASVQKTRSRLRQSRLHSETASMLRQSIAVDSADMRDDDDDDDDATDSGEWAITTQGIPVRASQNAVFA